MAKLITKFKFIKPGKKAGGYLKYIATREGVDKIDDSKKNLPASKKQKDLIAQILRDFPDTKDMHEYDDYLRTMTVGDASEFITRALEDNAQEAMEGKTYADYIATRPRAQRFGSHGLFTDDGVEIKLSKVSEELNLHAGNVWTAILSLQREDAERLGFDDGYRWRDMLRTQTTSLSENLKIPLENLRWFAAFHDESHHPHVHLIAYSVNPNEGYLTKQGVNRLRSSFAKDIFSQDLLCVYEKQTEHRNTLKAESRKLMSEMIDKINTGVYDDPAVETMLVKLADRLSKTGGKKVYGYLKADVKDLVDSIVDEMAKDERIAALYDLWYGQREAVIQTYTKELPERVPLSQNTEFKSVRNMVIAEAMNILLQKEPDDLPDEPEATEDNPVSEELHDAEREAAPQEKTSVMWRLYLQAKVLLDRDSESYDPNRAVALLIDAANMGCGVAKYRLGKMFLRGDEVTKNVDYALRWLEESTAEHNPYAEYLLGKTLLKGEDTNQDLPRAEDLLRRSVNQNNRYAAYTLGKAYLDGTALLQDIPEAIRLLTLSADNGFAPAEYLLGRMYYRGEAIPQDIPRSIAYLERSAEKGNAHAAYLAGKIYLTEDAVKDVQKAIRLLKAAAVQGNDYAEYRLGLLYLCGRDTERDDAEALRRLNASAEHGNPYAAQLLHSLQNNRNWSAAMGAFRLLHHISRIIQNRLEDERRGKDGAHIERKLRRRIRDKNEALGIKQG